MRYSALCNKADICSLIRNYNEGVTICLYNNYCIIHVVYKMAEQSVSIEKREEDEVLSCELGW